MRMASRWLALVAVAGAAPAWADALPFLPPGDARLRHLVQFEADEGNVPLASTWPIPTLDLPPEQRGTLYSYEQPGTNADAGWFVSGAAHVDQLRTFDQTPREEGEAGVQAGWAAGDYAGGVFRIAYDAQPKDGMKYRFDDSYVAWRFGNWWVSLGQQERWWGPGWDGSLILSNNARPLPSIGIDRASAKAPTSKWLKWIGPYRWSTFMGRFEDQRVDFPHPLLWGLRLSLRPFDGPVEIGFSRTAQWCRPGVCGLTAFKNVVLGHDNRGENVSANQEPGNQEAGYDARWHIGSLPTAIYFQVNGESIDNRNWRPRHLTHLVGWEWWSHHKGPGSWRAFAEFAGTSCGEWGLQSTDRSEPSCAYNNGLFTGGYYFRDRVIGDSLQGDGRMLTVGGLYLDAAERSWELRLRHGEINAYGASLLNTLATTPTELWTVQAKVDGRWRTLVYSAGAGVDRSLPQDGGHHVAAHVFLSLSRPW
ncbi:MAG: hypothetical protein JSR54_08460 [Proteobacteria bacterium]|nr:hypothetical protein [Pseudomonadota bacterium]